MVEAALRLMPAGFMERTIHLRTAEILSQPASRIQIMGDSVTARINASNVAQAANLPPGSVANYSLPGTSPVFAYYTLRRELAAGRVPSLIILAPHPANLESPMIDRFIGRFATPSESLDLFSHGVSLPDWLFGLTCRASIAMRDREEFRLALTTGDLGFFKTLHTPPIPLSQAPLPPSAPPPPLPLTDFPAQLSAPFSVGPVNLSYINAFCSLAASRRIKVAWVTLPVIALFKERAMANGGEARLQAFLNTVAAQNPNVTLLHPALEVYPDNCFADPWHLNPYGAYRLSAELGASLSKYP